MPKTIGQIYYTKDFTKLITHDIIYPEYTRIVSDRPGQDLKNFFSNNVQNPTSWVLLEFAKVIQEKINLFI